MTVKVVRMVVPYCTDTNMEFSFIIPKNAEFLSAGIKPNESNVSLWFLIDDQVKTSEEREFLILGTGHEFDGSTKEQTSPTCRAIKYLTTFFEVPKTFKDCYVWHLFEIL